MLIDADAQGSLTASLGFSEPDKLEDTFASVMASIINEGELESGYGILKHEEGIDLLPGNIELSGLEVSLVNTMSRELVMKTYIESVKTNYDYVLIDCMPSLGMLIINALACADSILIPVQAVYLPVKGLEQLIKTIGKVKRQINPMLEFIEGIAPVIDSDATISDVMYKYKDGVFKEFCKKAAGTESTKNLNKITNSNPTVWKVSLKNTGDNEVRTECLENGHIRIGWDEYGEDISAITEYTMGGKSILDAFVNKMQIGDIVVSCYSQTTIDAIGVVTGEPEWGTYATTIESEKWNGLLKVLIKTERIYLKRTDLHELWEEDYVRKIENGFQCNKKRPI